MKTANWNKLFGVNSGERSGMSRYAIRETIETEEDKTITYRTDAITKRTEKHVQKTHQLGQK